MGRVVVAARIENFEDRWEVERGLRPDNDVRSVEISDALIDTGSTFLSLPSRLIDSLGLKLTGTRIANTTQGVRNANIYGLVRLFVQGRECWSRVAEVGDNCPVLIGQLPLEELDFVVDPVGQRLLGNPAHGGEQMIELY